MRIASWPLLVLLGIMVVQTSTGQGTFLMGNYLPPYGVDAPVFDASGNRLSGLHFVATLFGGATSNSLAPAHFQQTLQTMSPTPINSFVNGQGGYFFLNSYVSIPTVPPGEYAWLRVVAWDLRLGATYQDVVNLGVGGYGQSPLFSFWGGGGGDPPIAPNPLIGLQSFSLQPIVPEPSTWALFALGATALYWARRRRAQRRL